jgi:hypothetical protein
MSDLNIQKKNVIVGAGGGGDTATASLIAGENGTAIGSANSYECYKKYLIKDYIKNDNNIFNQVKSRDGFTDDQFNRYFKEIIDQKYSFEYGFFKMNNNPNISVFSENTIGKNSYNSLLEESNIAKIFNKTDLYMIYTIGGTSPKYISYDGKPMCKNMVQTEFLNMVSSIDNFLDINTSIEEVILIDVGGDMMNNFMSFDINKMGRDEFTLAAWLYVNKFLHKPLKIKVHIYGPGVDGHDYPKNIIDKIKKIGFIKNNKLSDELYNKINDNYDILSNNTNLMEDKRALKIFYNAYSGKDVCKGLNLRREEKAKEISENLKNIEVIVDSKYQNSIYTSDDIRFFDKNKEFYLKQTYVKEDDWSDITDIIYRCFFGNILSKNYDNDNNLDYPNIFIKFIYSIYKMEQKYIDSVSFVPNYGEREIIYMKSYIASTELRSSNLDSLLLSKYANKPYAITKNLVSQHPGMTVLSKFGKKNGKYKSRSENFQGYFCILNDVNKPYENSNGPNIVFVPDDIYLINFFCQNEKVTKKFISELIKYKNDFKNELWKEYLNTFCNDDFYKINPKLCTVFKIIKLQNKNIENCGFDIISFCQTWIRKGYSNYNASFSVMSPHSQQKFYLENYNKFIVFFNSIPDKDFNLFADIKDLNSTPQNYRITFLKTLLINTYYFKINMTKDYGGIHPKTKVTTPAFINVDNLYAEFNKTLCQKIMEWLFDFF